MRSFGREDDEDDAVGDDAAFQRPCSGAALWEDGAAGDGDGERWVRDDDTGLAARTKNLRPLQLTADEAPVRNACRLLTLQAQTTAKGSGSACRPRAARDLATMAANAGTATPATVGRPGAMVAMYGVLSDAFAGGGTTPVSTLQHATTVRRRALTLPRLSMCYLDGTQAARSLEVHLLRLKPVFLRLLDKPPRDAAVRAQLAPNRPITIDGQPLTLSQGFLEHALKLSDQVRQVRGGVGSAI